MRTPIGFCLFVLLAASPSTSNAQCVDCVFPKAQWESLRPQQLTTFGWDAAKLGGVSRFLADSSTATGVVVVDQGRIVLTFGDVQELSYLASVRKSLLAMLYGYWIDRGVIDLSRTLADIGMDDESGLLPNERRATLEHLMTARSGIYHPASNGGDDLASAPARGSQAPGTYMLYNNWDFNAAGAAFESLTGRDIYDEFQSQIAIPIDMEDWDRSRQQKSGDLSISRNPAYHFWLSTRDMARVGHLMLNEGNWDGTQIVPADWARRIVSVVTPLAEMNPERRRERYFGYGYMWWVFDGPRATGPFEGAYTGRGAVGQWITVLPALEMVIAVKTNSIYRRTTTWESWHRMIELLFEAKGVTMSGPYPWG